MYHKKRRSKKTPGRGVSPPAGGTVPGVPGQEPRTAPGVGPAAQKVGQAAAPGGAATDLVYGIVGDRLVFVTRSRAEQGAALRRVLSQAGQLWGNLRAGLGLGRYEAMLHEMRERGAVDFPEFCHRERENGSGLADAGLRAAYDRLPVGQRLPWNHDPLDPADVPGVKDLVWEPFLQQEMLDWVPARIQQEFGRVEDTFTDGDFLAFGEADEAGLVAAFAEEGFTCVRDQALVDRACGN